MTSLETPRLLPEPDTHPTPRSPGRAPVGRRGGGRSWSAWLVLFLVVAGAIVGGYRLVEHRLAASTAVPLDRVTLVGDPVPVGSPDAAVVLSVSVSPGESVVGGAELAVIERSLPDGGRELVTLTAPLDGRVVRLDAQPGGVVGAGQPVVTLYDPAGLTFRTELPVTRLDELETGMVATISGPGLTRPVEALVDRVVPVLDPASAQAPMTVVLVPADPSSVAQLVPGIPLRGTLATGSGQAGRSVLDSGA